MRITMKAIAFIDMDGTILNIKSMFSFIHFFWTHSDVYGKQLGTMKYQKYIGTINRLKSSGCDRSIINTNFYVNFRNVSISLIEEISCQWWAHILNNYTSLFNSQMIKIIEACKTRKIDVVMVTGSLSHCANKVREHLGIKSSLHTNLIENNGRYTGKLIGSPIIGQGKAIAIKNFLKHQAISPN